MNPDELHDRAIRFVATWLPIVRAGNVGEAQHSREFIADFYDVFGISRTNYRQGFEKRVLIGGSIKRIDSLLPKLLLIEMESQGVKLVENPASGYEQGVRYAYALSDDQKPQYVLACDFQHFYLRNPATDDVWTTTLDRFVKDLGIFNFLTGYEQQIQEHQVQVNKRAAESISRVYRTVLAAGVQPNAASLLMTRIVFALFADDTEIFSHNGVFEQFLENTKPDGSDLLVRLNDLFSTLNTPDSQWLSKKREFRYINGGLFAMDIAKYTTNLGLQFDSNVRQALIDASKMDWSKISPVIFGSMFEGALDTEKRHDLGAHFTSETNILKIIDDLFMNGLHAEFNDAKRRPRIGGARTRTLNALHNKIANLRLLDPACGSGNFLIVAYRELRRLEHDILEALLLDENREGIQTSLTFVQDNIKVDVNQFYGIEIQGYAVSIARVGMWLMDHLMNLEASQMFGELYIRIPLHAGANVVQANALTSDWAHLFSSYPDMRPLSINELDYVFGNPPFIGQTVMSKEQKADLKLACPDISKIGKVDYVAGWYFKTVSLMNQNPAIKGAFVSTNSIAQGEQSVIVCQQLFRKGVHFTFAHQTFKWDNNGAAVFAVIIGFSLHDATPCLLYTYPTLTSRPVKHSVSEINEYLYPMAPVWLQPSNANISGLPHMAFGTMPRDGGNFILTMDESTSLLSQYPQLKSYIRPFIGSRELLHNEQRFILYLKNAPIAIQKLRPIYERIQLVKKFRSESRANSTAQWQYRPTELVQDQTTNSDVLLLPRVSSGNREYLPITFEKFPTIGSDQMFQVEHGTLSLLSILESKIHMCWLETVGGRLKGDFRYSNTLVYNTFPVPKLSKEKIIQLTTSGTRILKARSRYANQGQSLADMYDVTLMPLDLRKAHQANDALVDSLYGLNKPTNLERFSALANLYLDQVKKES
ncbi:DNA methyltransferase [Schleiferilactobacillus harbinensis]|uniref:site-specific DNA-methyltransferase (adenine-specific) n=1 Tax=Schleiferilactobacillus harbinensis TaxID=304207 RepID=A0A5P8M7Y2_9LACO|nr:DNA methyltransferase [Schleiferilactobacillus harbinensis]QFR24630.1 class I SAM-dependent DNA methyltransferase [Schleiferilactobacillus harbinensis]